MRTRVIAVLASVFLLAPATMAEATVCVNSTVFGTYVLTLAGVDAEGRSISNLVVATFAIADVNGNGTFSGTIFHNERGQPPATLAALGTYQILSNCWITIRMPELVGTTIRLDALTGFVSQGGALIIFASPFDSAVQLSGVATFVPF